MEATKTEPTGSVVSSPGGYRSPIQDINRNRQTLEKTEVDSSATLHHTEGHRLTDDDPNMVDWDGEDDPENPLNWSPVRRWTGVVMVAVITFLGSMASSILAPTVPEIMNDFHSSNNELSILVVSIFLLGFAFGPLVAAPLSEIHGRWIVYNVSNVLFVIFTVCCAVSSNLGMLIAFRFLAGCAGGTPQAIGGGTIHDLIPAQRRGLAMGVFGCGLLLGPIIGPTIGGYLGGSLGWRWVFWLITILSGLVTGATPIISHETSPKAILRYKTHQLQKLTGNYALRPKNFTPVSTWEVLSRSLVRPIRMLLSSPIVFLLSIFLATNYGYLYLFFTTLTSTFEDTYHFSTGSAGLAYLGLGVGSLAGLSVMSIGSDKLVKKRMASGNYKPEDRLVPMMIGTFCLPIGLFWYGWCAQAQVHWILPILGTAIFGVGMVSTLIPIMAYMVDAFTIHAASAIAATTVLRSIAAAILPLAAPRMFANLGLGWGNSLLGFIAIALLPVPWIFYLFGTRIREKGRDRD